MCASIVFLDGSYRGSPGDIVVSGESGHILVLLALLFGAYYLLLQYLEMTSETEELHTHFPSINDV